MGTYPNFCVFAGSVLWGTSRWLAGVITGKLDQPGTHVLDIVVSNELGMTKRPFRIVVGEEICLTPPMGWNSCYAYSEGVSAEHIKKVADDFFKSIHWNDMDMLQVGMRGRPNRFNAPPKKTRLTPDEQYTQMSMWCLQSNPLLLSCYIHQLDEFTMSLLTNDEVIEVNHDPVGKQFQRVVKDGDLEVWMKPMEDGSLAVGLFNRGDKSAEIKIAWDDLGIQGKHKVRDLWRQKDLGVFKDSFSSCVKSHGVVFVNVRKDTLGNQ